MKNILLLLSSFFLLGQVGAQTTGKVYDFNNGSATGWGSGSTLLDETYDNNSIRITSKGAGPSSESSYFLFSTSASTSLNLSANPYLSLKVKTSQVISLRVDLVDIAASVTNNSPIVREIKELGEWSLVTFNFSGLFQQKNPTKTVNSANIIGINIYINPGASAFNGYINIDDISFGDMAQRSVGNGIPGIKVDQIGFYPNATKIAIASSTPKSNFSLVNEENETVYSGMLSQLRYFAQAQDCVKIADFTNFTTPGRYKVVVDGTPSSAYFNIKDNVHLEISKAAIKYYYYNRLSIDLESKYAGKWARAAGHPDNVVYIHSSAATASRPENTIVSAPKGWYDAGDYNKYIINSGISTYTLMALYERFWPIYDTLNLNIPESGNNLPDILDEVKWNLDWMLAMQDPSDGGVYFKLTSKNFSGDIMPSQDKLARYMVGKSTSSALDFAATMATAYRIFKPFDDVLPGYADTCILKAYRAYQWAKENPSVFFNNPDDVSTGGYGDYSFSDEFTWAATELYISSQDDTFYTDINFNINTGIPGWQSVATLAFLSLSHNKNYLTESASSTIIVDKLNSIVEAYKTRFGSSAYRMAMSSGNGNDFYWGSNAVAANQAFVLLQDYYNTGDSRSYEAAQSNMEYLLGRNPLEYCFVTGFGTKSPMRPHHRPSVADGILEPVPGMLVGGPNDNPSSGEGSCSYPYSLPALQYTDLICSFSTNEIAINWNAPLSFILGAIEAEQKGVKPAFKYFLKGYPMAVNKEITSSELTIYPLPASDKLTFSLPSEYQVEEVEVFDFIGNRLNIVVSGSAIDLANIENGAYLLRVKTDKGVVSNKVLVQK